MYRTYKRRGLTLIELLIAILLMIILLAAVWVVYNTGFKVFNSQLTRTGVKGEVGKFFTDSTRELRRAVSVTECLPRSLTFTSDIDGDGLNETVQYVWSGAAGDPLNKIITDPPPASSPPTTTQTAVNSVSSPDGTSLFTYHDASGNDTSVAANVRLIFIDIDVTNKNESFRMRNEIRLRNL